MTIPGPFTIPDLSRPCILDRKLCSTIERRHDHAMKRCVAALSANEARAYDLWAELQEIRETSSFAKGHGKKDLPSRTKTHRMWRRARDLEEQWTDSQRRLADQRSDIKMLEQLKIDLDRLWVKTYFSKKIGFIYTKDHPELPEIDWNLFETAEFVDGEYYCVVLVDRGEAVALKMMAEEQRDA